MVLKDECLLMSAFRTQVGHHRTSEIYQEATSPFRASGKCHNLILIAGPRLMPRDTNEPPERFMNFSAANPYIWSRGLPREGTRLSCSHQANFVSLTVGSHGTTSGFMGGVFRRVL
jgi:hypothetical protein